MKTLFDDVYAPWNGRNPVGWATSGMPADSSPSCVSTWQRCASGSSCCPAPMSGPSSTSIHSCARFTGTPRREQSYGRTKISGKQILRKGLSPLVTTISAPASTPVIAGARLRAGRAASGKGAARMIAQAVSAARAAGVAGEVVVLATERMEPASSPRPAAVPGPVLTGGDQEPHGGRGDRRDSRHCLGSGAYAGAVRDPDAGESSSDAEVAEVPTPHSVPRRTR